MSVVASKPYVESRSDSYWIVGTRISLDSVVYEFQKGRSPEEIVHAFPLLSLEQVYGAIVFYLANRTTIDAYFLEEELSSDVMPHLLEQDSRLYQKLKAAKTAQGLE